MSTDPSDAELKIYSVPSNVLDLRRIQRSDGISFMTCFLNEESGDAPSVGVELRLTNNNGTIAITMRRVASTPESWHCTTSTIHLPPDAAADLAQSITSLGKRLKH